LSLLDILPHAYTNTNMPILKSSFQFTYRVAVKAFFKLCCSCRRRRCCQCS